MTSKEWLEQNPDVTREQLIHELIEWRDRAKKYHAQLVQSQKQLAKVRYDAK